MLSRGARRTSSPQAAVWAPRIIAITRPQRSRRRKQGARVERLRRPRAAPQERRRQRAVVHLKPLAVLLAPRVAVQLAVPPRLPPAVALADTDFWLPSGMTASPWDGWPSGVRMRWQSKNESW